METNKGSFHTIDVQSDMRYITYYLHYSSIKTFPELVIDNNPYVSLASLIGYKLILFNAHQLILDLKCRRARSQQCAVFEDSSVLSSFLNTLMNCKIPNDLAIELQQLASVMDPLRPDLEYVPNLACFNMSIDFGRTFPGFVYFLIHNLLADVSNYTNARELIDEIYQIVFCNIEQVPLTISNLFGGPFNQEQRVQSHDNWIRSSLEETLMPLFGYCLSERPTLIEIPIRPATFPQMNEINPYIYTLLGGVNNLSNIEQFVQSINRFYSEKDPSLPTLGSFYNKVSGMVPLTHSLEGPTLPTWHSFRTTNLICNRPKLLTDQLFVKLTLFCDGRESYSDTLQVPDTSLITKPLYQVEKKKFSPSKSPIHYQSFSKSTHVHQDVLWFQPYTRGTGMINHSLTLGLKIESAEIDGVSLPIPNPSLTLVNQNYEFFQGTLPLSTIQATFPFAGAAAFRFRDRTEHDDYEPISFNRRDIAKAVRPVFATSLVDDTFNGNFPFFTENGHSSLSSAVTYCQWNRSVPCPEDYSIYLWSSYRTHDLADETIYLYYTLRAFYGTNTVLSQTRHPTMLLPK